MTDPGSDNLLWADALIHGLVMAGVRRAVISPGSRSTPLVLACSRNPAISTWTQVDERCAAFFALGLAKHDGSPVALVATSGSAPAHWYPAIIEANHSGIPLLLLSADRPPELQGCGANQTTDQRHLFGHQVRGFFDPGPARSGGEAQDQIRDLGLEATHLARGQNPGPVHINLPFREPLLPEHIPRPQDTTQDTPSPTTNRQPDPGQLGRILEISSGGPGLIICGPATPQAGFPPAVAELARRMGLPLLADPLSGLRFGAHGQSNIICRYDGFLRGRFGADTRPDWVLRFGAAPISKTLLQYLEASRPSTILCAPRGDWPDPLHHTSEMVRSDPMELCNRLLERLPPTPESEWLQRFQQQEQRCRELQPEAIGDDPSERLVIERLIEAMPAGSTLFSGNSLSIRQLDSWSGGGAKPIRILANRGVSGIDGNISTLLGLGAGDSNPIFGLLGDLACYHDMNGLLAAPGIDGVLILMNNGGGGIFGHLPQAGLEQFEQHWLTPTKLDFSRVAGLYNLGFHRIMRQSEFQPALDTAMREPGLSLVEVMIDRQQSLERHRAWLDGVAQYQP
jgi:2-succinyl-5-enolpyruvyl-6-hydroxy-3-cyclohexene-1-carboxylate synthase